MLELSVLQSLEQLISRAEKLLSVPAVERQPVPVLAPLLTPALLSALLLERIQLASALLAQLEAQLARRDEAPAGP